MKRTETNGNVNISFNSIADVVNYIDTINTFNKYTLGNNKYMKVFREEFKVA